MIRALVVIRGAMGADGSWSITAFEWQCDSVMEHGVPQDVLKTNSGPLFQGF